MRLRYLAVVFALGLAACSAGTSTPTADASVAYEDLALGYGLAIPAGWTASRDYANTALLLHPPVLNPEDHLYSLNVAIDERWTEADATLDEYLAFRLPRMLRFTSLESLDGSAKSTLPNGMEVWQQHYEYRTGPQHLRASTRLFVSGGKGWAITATAPVAANDALWQQLLAAQASWVAKPAK